MSKPKDIWAGAIFVAVGAFVAADTLKTLRIGSAHEPGPGLFPLALSTLLILLGAVILLNGAFVHQSAGLAGHAQPAEATPWRGLVLTGLAIVMFGVTLFGLGMAPAIFITALLSSFASGRMRWPLALALALGLTGFCILIFDVGLDMNLKLFGPWIGG